MLRVILLVLIVLMPVVLIYTAGFWALLGIAVATGCVFLFSTRQGEGAEATQGGRLTGYGSTEFDTL